MHYTSGGTIGHLKRSERIRDMGIIRGSGRFWYGHSLCDWSPDVHPAYFIREEKSRKALERKKRKRTPTMQKEKPQAARQSKYNSWVLLREVVNLESAQPCRGNSTAAGVNLTFGQ